MTSPTVAILELANSLLDQVQSFYFTHPRSLFAIIICCLYLVCYLNNAVKKPLLFSADGRFTWFLKANCTTIGQYYWPTLWCYETHLLTPISTFLRGLLPALKYHREYVRTFDGGQISLDWYDTDSPGTECTPGGTCTSTVHRSYNQPIAIFLPGLTGDSQAEYIRTMVPIASNLGYRVVTINYRGLGNTRLLTPRLYCAANDDDLRAALIHIRVSNPHSRIVATGVSMGGIIIGRYLISTGTSSAIDAAFLVSVVWNFMDVAETMERGLNYPLTKLLTKSLINIVLEHKKWFEGHFDMGAVRRARSIREFDEAFTIRMFNFATPGEYYKEASHKGLPMDEVTESSHVAMLVTARGGHIGFMEGLFPKLFRPPFPGFSERTLEQYLKALYRLPNLELLDGLSE